MRGLRVLVTICMALGLIAVASGPAGAQEALKVGEHVAITIDSGGVTDVPVVVTPDGYSYTLKHDGATYIALHFDRFDLAPGDAVVISDAKGGQSYRMTGLGKRDAGAFWARHIKGDTAVIEWITDGPVADHGFSIDEYAAGNVDLGEPAIDAICGTDDKRNAVCYQTTYPTEYDKSRAVARLLIQGSSLCTGWLASSSDHLITNEHCITSSSDALNTDYEFMAEAPNCSDSNCQLCHAGDIYSGASFVQDNPSLDYALVTLSGNPSATYGYLDIDNRDAIVGEEIYIPQHPAGYAKELGIESSDSNDPTGICTVTTFAAGCTSSSYQDVGYSCDTEGGSSGSPVIARSSHKVVALHHCANCPNRGVPIDLICDEVCGYFGPECSVDADCDDGNPCTTGSCVSGSCVHDPVANCCGNGTCEAGEDCTSCSTDCATGTAAACGNGICETADGEDCTNCPADCNGVTTGRPFNRYCCGSDATCADPRCTGNGNTCTDQPGVGSCCGDGVCEGAEDETTCAIDCSACTVNADCDDGDSCTTDTCDAGTCFNTPLECSDGDACTVDTCTNGVCSNDPLSCDDGDACTIDSCDSATGCSNEPINCDDANACTIDSCSGGSCVYDPVSCDDGDACTIDSCDAALGCTYDEPACQDGDGCCPSACDSTNDSDCGSACLPLDASCTSDAECCSNKCRGRPGGMTCK